MKDFDFPHPTLDSFPYIEEFFHPRSLAIDLKPSILI
jgi:hypothetical protein